MGEEGVRTRLWRNGVLEKEDFPFADISDYVGQDGCLVWADLADPDSERLTALADELSLNSLAIEDAVAHHERPKASRYATHLFLTCYAMRFDEESNELASTQISAFMLGNALVTVRRNEWFDINTVTERWDDNGDLCKFGVRSLLWGLLDVVVDGYFEVVENLDDQIEELEDLLFDEAGRSQEVQKKTFALRKALVQARRVILPMREVVNTIMRREHERGDELQSYFEDLYDHVLRASEWTESLRDMVTSVFETNLSLADARLNSIMKKLTSYAALIAIPTAVTGFYGQNVPYPGFGQHWGFWVSLSIMITVVVVLYFGFKRKDWL